MAYKRPGRQGLEPPHGGRSVYLTRLAAGYGSKAPKWYLDVPHSSSHVGLTVVDDRIAGPMKLGKLDAGCLEGLAK